MRSWFHENQDAEEDRRLLRAESEARRQADRLSLTEATNTIEKLTAEVADLKARLKTEQQLHVEVSTIALEGLDTAIDLIDHLDRENKRLAYELAAARLHGRENPLRGRGTL